MRRLAAILLLLGGAASTRDTAQAQSLVGQWAAGGTVESGVSFRTIIEFLADGRWSHSRSERSGPPELANLNIVTCNGRYRFDGQHLRAWTTGPCQVCASCVICTAYCTRYKQTVSMDGTVVFAGSLEANIAGQIFKRQ
ncbi:MAG: hypothetical protein EXR07_11550 [Acetobacteraceae bacterium]|nr:hypothetical protein [Acetobacteraceae bacterium]